MTAQEVSHKSVAGSCVRWGQPWEVTEIALLDTNIKARKGLLGFFFSQNLNSPQFSEQYFFSEAILANKARLSYFILLKLSSLVSKKMYGLILKYQLYNLFCPHISHYEISITSALDIVYCVHSMKSQNR